jgi:hypothetical protein
MATIKVKWTVHELANVLTQFDTQKVYRSTTGESGPYSEITGPTTRVDLVVDQSSYYYDDLSGDTSYWYRIAYFNSTTSHESEQSDPIQGTGGGNYLTVNDVRDAGWTETVVSDARALEVIQQIEAFIEKVTGRWFYPKYLVLRLDGTGTHILPVRTPIIEVEQIRVLSTWSEIGTIYGDVSLDNVRVSNRHLTQGLMTPDDREAPALIFEVYEHAIAPYTTRVTNWHSGEHNVEITGWFGYTDPDPNSIGETETGSQIPLSRGLTPSNIKRVCELLFARWYPLPSDRDDMEDATRRRDVKRWKTRDQEIEFIPYNATSAAGLPSDITGDPEIDSLLGMFVGQDEVAFV